MKSKFVTILMIVIMMATTLAVPSFAVAADEQEQNAAAQIEQTTEAGTIEGDEIAEEEVAKPEYNEELDVDGFKTQIVTRTSLKLTWKKNKNVDGYVIYSYDKGTDQFKALKTIKTEKTTSYTNKKLKAGKNYYYAIAAYEVQDDGTKEIGEKTEVVKAKTPKKITQKTQGFWQTPAGAAIKVAKKKKGKRYVHGAAGPNAFDCSGFVYWVYNKNKSVKKVAGKSFIRTSARDEYRQLRKYNIGKDVKNAQPGDIIFFARNGGTGSIHHVAIYYGDGKIIHASTPRTGVRISPVKWSGRIAAIVRMPGMK